LHDQLLIVVLIIQYNTVEFRLNLMFPSVAARFVICSQFPWLNGELVDWEGMSGRELHMVKLLNHS